MDVTLRAVEHGDLNHFFEFQRNPDANVMAAFTPEDPEDRAAFDERWRTALGNSSVVVDTIIVSDIDGPGTVSTTRVGGYVMAFPHHNTTEVTYWIDPSLWGHGIASAALAHFLVDVTVRPLRARVVTDNAASLRILRRCGFSEVGTEVNFANARGVEVTEVLFELT